MPRRVSQGRHRQPGRTVLHISALSTTERPRPPQRGSKGRRRPSGDATQHPVARSLSLEGRCCHERAAKAVPAGRVGRHPQRRGSRGHRRPPGHKAPCITVRSTPLEGKDHHGGAAKDVAAHQDGRRRALLTGAGGAVHHHALHAWRAEDATEGQPRRLPPARTDGNVHRLALPTTGGTMPPRRSSQGHCRPPADGTMPHRRRSARKEG